MLCKALPGTQRDCRNSVNREPSSKARGLQSVIPELGPEVDAAVEHRNIWGCEEYVFRPAKGELNTLLTWPKPLVHRCRTGRQLSIQLNFTSTGYTLSVPKPSFLAVGDIIHQVARFTLTMILSTLQEY